MTGTRDKGGARPARRSPARTRAGGSSGAGGGGGPGGRVLLLTVLLVVVVLGGLWLAGRMSAVPVRAPEPSTPVPAGGAATPPVTATPGDGTGSQAPALPESPPAEPPVTPPVTPARAPELHWGYVPNSVHKAPGVPAATETLLRQHNAFWLGPAEQDTVFLTFDSGYDAGLTPQILSVLKAHKVKAIFYFTGANMRQHPELIKEILAAGHAIGNHTMNHLNLTQLSPEKLDAEVDGVDKLYAGLTGKHLRYFRFPEGTYNEATLARLQAKGYRTAFWSIALRDWLPLPGGKAEALRGVVDHLHPGAVILLHSVSRDDLAALDDILTQTVAAGYRFGDPETL